MSAYARTKIKLRMRLMNLMGLRVLRMNSMELRVLRMDSMNLMGLRIILMVPYPDYPMHLLIW